VGLPNKPTGMCLDVQRGIAAYYDCLRIKLQKNPMLFITNVSTKYCKKSSQEHKMNTKLHD